MGDILLEGREAAGRHAWNEAREAFAEADQDKALTPADLEIFADAAWWSGYPDDTSDALERAYAGYADAGEVPAAASVASLLAYLAFRRNAFAVGGGWMGKAEHLLENEPEGSGHAWMKLLHAAGEILMGGDTDAGLAFAEEALELAGKHNVPEVYALATSFKGYALVGRGDWKHGMALIDEAAAAAVSGELQLRAASDIYCNTIACCRNMADYRRASEWTEEADRWMQRHSLGGYPGVCRVHRAELKRLHGSYSEAEQEARVACEELERYHLLDTVGFAHYEVGEARRRKGDLEAAQQAFSLAYEFGADAQPGMALLTLARGDIAEAASSIGTGLARDADSEGEDSSTIDVGRYRLLPAQVTIALAGDDLETAEAAAVELERMADSYDQPAFAAAALTARGAIDLHVGKTDDATSVLDRAWRLWREIEFPYESAQARMLLGQAQAAGGDETTANMEFSAARSAFMRLGAALEVRRVDELLGDGAAPVAGDGRRITKTFMFTDIVTSTDLVGLIGDDAWESLLHWHDQALRSEFSRNRGQEVRHTGDGFFVAFDEASDGMEAAVAIQRRLAEHRHQHGFAPWVRIGLHTTEATPQGSDYSGHGVHVAARVGDVGDREEIVISADTLQAAGTVRFSITKGQSMELKGVSEPLEIHTIDWQ